jgi:hypothetical protein
MSGMSGLSGMSGYVSPAQGFPLDGLVFYWSLHDTGGLRADLVSNNPMRPLGNPDSQPGKFGVATRVNDDIWWANPPPPGSFSVAGWALFDRDVPCKVAQSDGSWSLDYKGNGRWTFGGLSCTIPSADWYWVCAWWGKSSGEIGLSVNGSQPSIRRGVILKDPGFLRLGGYSGLMERWALWSRILSGAEQERLYSGVKYGD